MSPPRGDPPGTPSPRTPTRPPRAPLSRLPLVKFINFARCAPTRKTHQSAIQSFGQPGTPMRASSAATTMSQQMASCVARPTQCPCTCAIVGFGTSHTRSMKSCSLVTPRCGRRELVVHADVRPHVHPGREVGPVGLDHDDGYRVVLAGAREALIPVRRAAGCRGRCASPRGSASASAPRLTARRGRGRSLMAHSFGATPSASRRACLPGVRERSAVRLRSVE